MKCLMLGLFVMLITVVHSHSAEEIQRGKEKWFKKPEDINTNHHHHKHDHHGHGHHIHDNHVHDYPGHNHDENHYHTHKQVKHDHGPDHHHHQKRKLKNRSFTETIDMWWQAIGATLAISAFPFFILNFIPLESNESAYKPMLKILLSFASGGLLGDAFLHLIPHAISPHTHGEEDHHHHHHHEEHDHGASTMVGMWVMAGILAFLCVEKLVRLLQGGEGHCHHHMPTATDNKTEDSVQSLDEKTETSLRKRKFSEEKTSGDQDESEEKLKEGQLENKTSQMAVTGYLNLAADFFHNFTDGLAIGASFLGGQKLGMITTLTILFHEIPHEIGDFAILVQSGCDKKKAMWLQLSTATGAMLGCIIGLLAENVGEVATSWILPFTAGGFIYIATVSVIPELLKDASDFKQTCKEIFAMLFGIFMMVIIAFLEEH